MSIPSRKENKQLQFSQNHTSHFQSEKTMDKSDLSENLLESTNLPDFPLMKHPIIPAIWRYGMPIIILLNIGVFVWSNMNVGAFVYLRLDLASLTTPSTLLKQFTLIGSTVDMWHAGVYTLSILIAVFSGIWPYTKLIFMMCCWVIDNKRLSYRNRERLLVILDTMGKWSLLDSYIMVLMIVAFRYQIIESLSSISGGVDVYVVPGFGLYSFVIGTIVSLLITHTEIHYHRKTIEHNVKHDLTLVSKLQPKSIVKVHIGTSILVFALLFLIVGYLVDSFTFKFLGAAGWILGEDASSTNYSMMSLGNSCDLINEWMKLLMDEKVFNFDEPLCFDNEVTLLTGCGLLFGSATLYFIMSTVMIRYIQRNLEQKLKKTQNDIEENVKDKQKQDYASDFESTEVDINKRKNDGLSI